MQQLSGDERLRLLRFVCSFVWTDLVVTDEERDLVRRLVERCEMDQDERRQVARWIETPPPPEDVDPTEIPREHRELFLKTIRETILVDGRIADEERESLELLAELLT